MKHAVTSGPLAYQVTLIYEALFLIMPVISFGWSRKSKWRPKNGFGFYLKPEETIRNYVMHKKHKKKIPKYVSNYDI